MPKLPEPAPDRLTRIGPELVRLPAGSELWRVYRRGGEHPVRWDELRTFGPLSGMRFDHHPAVSGDPPRDHPDHAVLYAASEIATAIAEALGGARVVDRSRSDPWLVGFALAREVNLLDLTGTWPTRAGASMAIASGRRDRCRRWSQAIHATYSEVEGLLYPSSMHANRPAVALFERARTSIPARPVLHRPLVDPALLPDLHCTAAALGYGLR